MLSRTGVLILMITAACSASPSNLATPWRVELATSGGIAGRGIGNVTLDSDGTLSVTTMTRKACTYRVTEEELSQIESLLAASHPEKWGKYVPENNCCDRIGYTLTYRTFTAEWIDDPLPMPQDLVKLSEALNNLRGKYTGQCLQS